MPHTASALDDAIDALVHRLVACAQHLDEEQWAYTTRVFTVETTPGGESSVVVSGWIGRALQQFRGIDIDDTDSSEDSRLNQAMAQALVESAAANPGRTLIAIVRVTRMPQDDPNQVEVAIDFVELLFDNPVDIADRDFGGYTLFGDL